MADGSIQSHIPEIEHRFKTGVDFIKQAEPRPGPHALRHQLSSTQANGSREFTGFASKDMKGSQEQPMHVGDAEIPSAQIGALQPPPVHIGGPHPEGEGQDLTRLIEASVVDVSQCLPWDKIFIRPVLKARLETTFDRMERDNAVARVDGTNCNGSLLFGRPGTGKTVLAYATARLFGLRLYDIDMSDINSKWQSESEK